jgi:hypothetical protein
MLICYHLVIHLLTYLLIYLLTYLLTYSTQQNPSWQANQFSASQKNSSHFKKPESLLPHLKQPATCPYPEPA